MNRKTCGVSGPRPGKYDFHFREKARRSRPTPKQVKMKTTLTIYKFGLLLAIQLLLLSPLQAQTSLETEISIEIKEMPLEKVLQEIEDQTEFKFSYSRDLIPNDHKVTGKFEKQPLRDVLKVILEGTGIRFERIGTQIALIPSGKPLKRKANLNGFITDQLSGEVLAGAAIYDKLSGIGTYSNKYGFYSLDLPSDSSEILVTYMGYSESSRKLILTAKDRINWELAPAELELGTVEINGKGMEGPEKATQMSSFKLSRVELKKAPALLGEVDMVRTLHLLPGVRAGYEGSAGMHVRGGGPDQNLVLLDDVPIYNSSHLFGFFSIFNPDAVRNVELVKGGFPARYGGRTSSILDVRMKEGNMNEFGLDASIGLIAAKATAEGPIKKGKTSFMLSGRRTYLDALAVPLQKRANKRSGAPGSLFGYRFWDFNGKINHKFSEKDRLYLSFYAGRDRENHVVRFNNSLDPENNYVEQKGGLAWHNVVSSLRWNHLFSDRLFVNTALIYSDYKFDLSDGVVSVDPDPEENGSSTLDYHSRIQDIGVKTDFYFRPGRRHVIQWGGALTRHRFQPGVRYQFNEGSFGDNEIEFTAPNIPALEGNVYVEDEVEFNSKVSANLGLHASSFKIGDTFYNSLQPRFSGRYQFAKRTALKASFATMAQNLHLLTNSGVGLPTDLWVPPTEKVLPQKSMQVAVGFGGSIGKLFEWSVEGYYKKMENIITYDDQSTFLDLRTGWEEKVVAGNGKSKGVEVFLRKKLGVLTGWLGYTLSKTDEQYDELNGGESFPSRFDKRHDFSIALNLKLNKKIQLSTNWVVSSGQVTTLPTAMVANSFNNTGNAGTVNLIYDDRNNYRMRPYHRLDLGISFYKKKKWGERWWNLGVYNAYNRLNPFYITYNSGFLDAPSYEFHEVSPFPVLPYFSYRIKL